jgi:hypothetical protein
MVAVITKSSVSADDLVGVRKIMIEVLQLRQTAKSFVSITLECPDITTIGFLCQAEMV